MRIDEILNENDPYANLGKSKNQLAKQEHEKDWMYQLSRGISRFLKRDPDYDPYDQKDDEQQWNPNNKPAFQSDQAVTWDEIYTNLGKDYGLSGSQAKLWSDPNVPLPSEYEYAKDFEGNIRPGTPTDDQVKAYRKSIGKLSENFADGKVKGKSRPGRVKRAGASCNGSVTELRKKAKNASGEKAKMYHWCANMKSGKKKK